LVSVKELTDYMSEKWWFNPLLRESLSW